MTTDEENTLRRLIAEVLDERLGAVDRELPPGRLGFTEHEAAERLGIPRHVLRDCRRRGEIQETRRLGRRVWYSRETLERFASGQDK
jgi:hypothetical protein